MLVTTSYVYLLTARILCASEVEGEVAVLFKVVRVQAIYMFSADAFSFRHFFAELAVVLYCNLSAIMSHHFTTISGFDCAGSDDTGGS